LDFGDKILQIHMWCHQLMSLNFRGLFRLSRRVVKRLSSAVTWVMKRLSSVVTWVVTMTSCVVTWVVNRSSPHCNLRSSVILVFTLVILVVSR
jgi:ABC-type proline/glycine betaine transport system permease subunit